MNSCLLLGDQGNGADCYNGSDNTCPVGTIYKDLNLSDLDAQLATSLTVLGAWVGSMFASRPAGIYGRRYTLLFNTIFFFIGTAASSSGDYYALFIGRFICGIGVGVASSVAPTLLSEIASDDTKGVITTLCQVMVTAAIFLAAVVAYGFVTYVPHGWQYVLGLGCAPAVVFVMFFKYVPESPKWLVSKNRIEEAYKTLASIRPDNYDQVLLRDEIENMIKDNVHNEAINSAKLPDSKLIKGGSGVAAGVVSGARSNANEASWSDVFVYKKAVIIGCGLMFFQTMTGINTVIFYSTTIFTFAGFQQGILGTSAVTLTNCIATVFAAYYVDKVGRKFLMNVGTATMLVALIVLSSVLISIQGDSGPVQGIVAVLAILVYIIGFAIGLGAAIWVLMSEIMPTRLRSKAMSLFLSINWGFNFLIGLLTLTSINALGGVNSSMSNDEEKKAQKNGVAILYFIFAAFCVLCLSFLNFYVPETRGKSPDELNDSIENPMFSSANVGLLEEEDSHHPVSAIRKSSESRNGLNISHVL